MREIKFRAWDKDKKRMEEVWALDIVNEFASYSNDEKRYSTQGYDVPLILMQYTGLKDRNGVEIYEGDIIRYPDAYMNTNENGDWDEIASTGQIKWDDKLAQFYVTKRESVDNDSFWEAINEAEVIGNIYENTNLLEVK